MDSTITELSPVLYEVSVEVPWDQVQKVLDAGFREVAKNAKVKGFRPGKVPRHVVKRLFGPQVHANVTETLVERGLMRAVTEHDLHVVAQPEVDPIPIADGQPFSFKAKVEVRPAIESVQVDGLVVYEEPTKIADEAIEEEIARLRKLHADLREPEPMRGATDGDELILDYRVLIDGELKEGLGAEGRPVELGDESLLDGFEEGLRGMKPGESKSIDVDFPADHPNEEMRGRTVTFEVDVGALRERLMPEVDDDFAQDCGEFETLAELREDIVKRLSEKETSRKDSDMREQLIDGLIALNNVPVPPSMVKQQQQQMMYEMATFAKMLGQGLDYSMLDGIEDRALRRVRAGLLLAAFSKQEGIDIGEAEIQAKLEEVAAASGKNLAKVRAEHRGERLEQLENQLLEEKLMTLLRERATIVEGPRPTLGKSDTDTQRDDTDTQRDDTDTESKGSEE